MPFALNPSDLARAHVETWQTGQEIFIRASPPSAMFYVLDGQVLLTRLLEQGERKILHIVDAGHFFFEALHFYPQSRAVLAHAIQPTRTARFAAAVADELIDASPRFRRVLLASMAAKALAAGTEIVDLAYAAPEARMLRVLQNLYRHRNETDGEPGRLHLTQALLAEHLGLHPVTVNRTLKKLERAGSIRLGRGSITLLVPRPDRTSTPAR